MSEGCQLCSFYFEKTALLYTLHTTRKIHNGVLKLEMPKSINLIRHCEPLRLSDNDGEWNIVFSLPGIETDHLHYNVNVAFIIANTCKDGK